MVHALYKNFLSSPAEYRAAEKFWSDLVRGIARSLKQEEWIQWIASETPNGSPVALDGNPICNGRSNGLSRAFRIIQHPSVGDTIDIAAWLKHYEEEFVDLPRNELVINLSLSDESAKLAAKLLRKWMTPRVTPAAMGGFIAKTLPPMGI